MQDRPIGKVTATEAKPTSCTTVRFWIDGEVIIRPFDIVRISQMKNTRTYAIVTDLEYLTDSSGHLASFVSSDFGDVSVSPQTPRLGTTVAEAEVLYNDGDPPIEMPLQDGAHVYWADEDGIREALGLKAVQHAVPAGYLQMSNGTEVAVEFESSFLLGPEGAHLNIAGISGLATKTSYAMFLLNAIQQKRGDAFAQIIFNVKGTDLLRIDEPNPDLTPAQQAEWEKCGLKPAPFCKVNYLYPYSKSTDRCYSQSRLPKEVLEEQYRSGRAANYLYDVDTGKERLDLLFADIDDPNQTMESIAGELVQLPAETWESFRREVADRTEKGKQKGNIPVVSYRKFARLLKTRTNNDIFSNPAETRADQRRQTTISRTIRHLQKGHVLVIDIEPLPDYLQCLVFGDVVRTIYGIKSGDEEDTDSSQLGTIVIFADELNKYAPKTGGDGRTLTQNLLEVTERGRSLGVVLFGAEQFRSGVHDRVLGNCSTNAFGRTSPVEIAKCADYRYFPNTYQSAVTRLPKGWLLLQHAAFKTSLIKLRFPFSSYRQPKGR